MERVIKISSCFGHEVMALNFAKALGVGIVIVPDKDTKEEYDAEAIKIYDFMHCLYGNMVVAPFEDRMNLVCRDVIGELKSGQLSDEEWDIFFSASLKPDISIDLPIYHLGPRPVLMIPQKLISDGECGLTAKQQSLNPEAFSFLKNEDISLVLGQHFHKVNDLEMVKKLAEDFNLYVPGIGENPEVLGIRGVKHAKYFNLYSQLIASVGIAGTHTWIMLALFPNVPQIILYNKNGVENWDAIGKAARKAGRNVYTIGFDNNTDMKELPARIQEVWKQIV